jgi:hypothetical protein
MKLAILTAILFAGCATAQTFNINPFLSCVAVDPVSHAITAYWGYESFEANIVQVQIGQDNQFIPAPAAQGQPILLFPGYHDKAFRMVVIGPFVEWSLLGSVVEATQQSTPCSSAAAPPTLPPAVVGMPYTQQLSAVGNQTMLSWSTQSALDGLTLSPSGVLSGTPSAAGTFPLQVKVTDGINTSSRTYQLVVSSALNISDAASLRAAGFTPAYRTVISTSSTISATAACAQNEFVITGGGTCTVPNNNTVQGRIASSSPLTNGWQVTCSGGTATAVAICNAK